MSSHELLDAVDALYRAVLEGPQRDRVPEVIGDLMNADMTGLWCFSTDSRHAYGHQYGNPAAFRDYLTNWAGRDTVIHDVVTTHRGTTATMEGVLKQRPSLCRAPAFEGFYEHHDFVNAAGHFRLIAPGWIGGVAALRGRRPGPFRRREQAHLDRLGPHIARALALAVQFDTLDVRETGVERLLTDLGLAMIACTPEGRVLDLTAHAERALRTAAPGIRIRNGHIRGVEHGFEARLRAALGDAGRGHYPPTEFPLRRDDGQRIWCTVLPLPRENETAADAPHDCLVMLQAPGSRVPIRAEQVARSLRVSASEGDVLAGLMRGEDVEAIARRRGGSVETVRSYEKSMRAKLGCHSRAELVARAWSTISTVPAPPPPP